MSKKMAQRIPTPNVPNIEHEGSTAIGTYAQDIVDTVREPLLMLDATLRVKSANRAFYQAFQVSPEETENQLIYELGNGQWDIPDLRTLLEDIVPRNSVFNNFELEHDFPIIGPRVMLLNARQLVTGNHGELLVLAMEDVTERRRAESVLKAIGTYAQNVVDSVREPLLMLDVTLRVQSANHAFYKAFQVTPGETVGHLIYELGNGQWDIPDLRTLLEEIVPKSSVFNNFEIEHTFPTIGKRVMLLHGRQLLAGIHDEHLVFAMEDITDRRRTELNLEDAHQATLDVCRTKSAEHEQRHTILQERNKIVQDIHDTLAQGFSGILMQLAAAKYALKQEQVQAHLDQIQTLARQNLQEANRSIRTVKPMALNGEKLPDSLKHLIQTTALTVAANVSFQLLGIPFPLSLDEDDQLFRIGNKALAIAINHSKASNILIELHFETEQVRLCIRDDGNGFDVQSRFEDVHFDLLEMQERANQMGGKFTLESRLNQGALITVTKSTTLAPN